MRAESARRLRLPAGSAVPGLAGLALLAVPLLVLTRDALRGGWDNLWGALTLPAATAALKFSIGTAAAVAVFNAASGTAAAWALSRRDFPGRRAVDALLDLPLALPGLAAGAVVGAVFGSGGTAAAVAALLFVTLPFVPRTVQPLLEAGSVREEEAARALGASPSEVFRRVTLPRIAPGILSGAALSFARALGELGAVSIAASNIPLKTQAAAVYAMGQLESDDRLGASAVSLALVAAAVLFSALIEAWRPRAAAGRP